MDCREAQVVLSAMADGAPVPPDHLADLRAHCRRCSECAAFATAVARLRKVKPPQAPRGLAKRIAATVAAEMAEARAEEEAGGQEAAAEATLEAPAEPSVVPLPLKPEVEQAPLAERSPEGGVVIPWLSRERLWTVIAAVGTSAAVVLLAVIVSGQLSGRAALDQEADEAISRSLSGGAPTEGAASPPAGSASTPQEAAPAQAPPFVAYNGKVYAPSTSAEEVNPSRLTTVGVVYSALTGAGSAEPLQAYTRPADTSLVILKPDGSYQVCAPVIRSYSDAVYQLTTGTEIPRYGVWPRLPTDIPEPTESTGAPVFIGVGSDQLGVRVYARIGADTSGGIAVGPGTPRTDPAAGNPYWTWWVRVQ